MRTQFKHVLLVTLLAWGMASLAEARNLNYGVFFAKDAETGALYKSGGSGDITVSQDGGESYSHITALQFNNRGYAFGLLYRLNRLADNALVRIAVAFNEGAEGTPKDVVIEQRLSDFRSEVLDQAYSRWLGSYDIDVSYDDRLDIVDTAIAAGSFGTLVAAVQAAGLEETLRSEGPFTVFAPTDEAFAALPEGTVAALLNDIPQLTDILLYHVVGESLDGSAVVSSTTIETANEKDVIVRVDEEGRIYINDSEVIINDIETANGIIHVIDQVLLPPTLPAIPELAAGAGIFNTLGIALELTGLDETLRGEGPFTVFAPTDGAFAALPAGVLDSLVANPEALTDILLYHVATDRLKASDVVASDEITTALGESVHVRVEDGNVFINDAQVLVTDLKAENGIVHVIDTVLVPKDESDIVDTAIGAGSFEVLVAALEATGLDETLRGDGPFTVFAPTDEAFGALPEGALEKLLAKPRLLSYLLLGHVVYGDLDSSDVLARRYLRTASGQWQRISQNSEGAFIGKSKLLATDVGATNGTIHVIDRVIIPWWFYRYL